MSDTLLRDLSVASFRLTDGRGVMRCIASIIGPSLPVSLRHALPSDVWVFYRWVSDPIVRQFSINSSYISPSHHQKWFIDSLSDSDSMIYLMQDRLGLPIGQIRFQLQEYS